ncbi:hypothetical protein SLEP1_g45377 [Rubroshorea leprosula]|uniref:CCHC-type domain-containing protein n=1 Tax=Rubroshorea leprosula TaxID=152421 RepID=A0AAV5LJK1_9ROSI|nr:hypothetical protein SLEP1_g45377 [Rubroshorea leprosula]
MATRDETPNSAASKHSAVTMLEPNITRNPISFNSAAFPVQLTPNNYLSWKAQFVSLLGGYELDGFLDGSHPCPNITLYIAAAATAQQAWETLAKLYANRSRTWVITLKERLQTMKRDGRPVFEYLRSLKTVADELGTVDHPLSDDDLTVYILNGLGPEFRKIAASLQTRDSSLSFDDVHDRLVAHEESLRRDEARIDTSPVTAYFASNAGLTSSTSSSAGPFPTSGRQSQWHSQQHRGRGNSNQSNRPNQHRRRGQGPRYPTRPIGFTCQLCGHAGHLARNCPSFWVQSIGPMANFASSSNGFLDDCLLDSGANNHVTTNLANLALHSEYNGPDELQIGDGTEHTFPAPFKHSCLQQLDFTLDSLDDLPSPPTVSAVAPHESLVHEAVPSATVRTSQPPFTSPTRPASAPPPESQQPHSPTSIASPPLPPHSLEPIIEPIPQPQPLPPPEPIRTHPMLTRSQNNIFKPKFIHQAVSTYPIPICEPTCVTQALKYPNGGRLCLRNLVLWNWPIRQLDVNNAFLHGHLEEKLFMAQPVGFVDPALPHHVCRLRKSIYGLKQAPQAWFQELKQFIISQGFSHSRSDSSLFVYHRNSTWIYFLVYVDDILITGSDPSVVSSLINCMSTRFSIKDLGTLSYFLGIEAVPTNAGLFLSQHKYVNDLLHRFRMHEAKPVATPLATNTDLDRDTMVSTTGYIVFLGQNPISWRATKQKAVARSSTEAEYRALAATASEVVWIRHLLGELGIFYSPSSAIFCDNIGATYLSLNPVMHSRMKHIAIDLHFIRDLVDQRVLHVSHIASQDQLADAFTKPLSSIRFSHLRSKIRVTNGTTILRRRIKESKSPP